MSDAQVWEKLKQLMPLCDTCGKLQEPGQCEGSPVLMCTTCSTIGVVDHTWLAGKVREARKAVGL